MQALRPINETHKFLSYEKLKTKSIVGGGGEGEGGGTSNEYKRVTIYCFASAFYWVSVARVH